MQTYTIIYKSGAKVRIRARGLSVTRYASGAISVKWEAIRPSPFLLGVDDIAAIFEGKV